MNTPTRRRALQARQTHNDIVASARRLFAERGYRRTTVQDIAAAAGVAVQTVYDSVGSKPALVLALNDVVDVDAGIAALVQTAFASGTTEAIAGLPARITVAIIDRAGDIIALMLQTAPTEPAVQAALDTGRSRHLAGARTAAETLAARGDLAEGVTADGAADTIAALCEPGLALTLRDSYGWSSERIEQWMIDAVRTLILRRR